ncbi:MAG: peptide ABC transporter substrate-binding protein [Epsilonproteobacteria bacterium]|nr:MAG: peptide ABC transporter substrate-binding protein [Campylobacterota bacterium]
MYKVFLICLLVVGSNSQTLNLSLSSNPSRINPILSTDSASSEISGWIFNGLFKYDKNGDIINDLASSYYFENNTTLIINLKKGVLWHDDKPFGAKDVLFTYNQIQNPKVFTPLKSSFEFVKSVKIINNTTIKITYKEPYFKSLHIWMTGMLPKHILQHEPDIMTSNFNKQPVGTGAYTINKFITSQDITLKKFDKYFGDKPKIDTISYKYLPDINTAFFALKQQSIDIGSLTPLQIDRQISKKFRENFQIVQKQSFSYTYMGLNLQNKKFQNKNIREAISLSINKQELVDILFFGYGEVCHGPFLPNSFAFNNKIKSNKQNINKAKQLLKKAGYDEKNPLVFTTITNSNNPTRVYATQIIQHQLQKAGIKMNIRVLEWQAFLNTVVLPKNFEAVVLGWGLSLMPDAKPLWHSSSSKKGGFNFVGYDNKKVDKLIESSAKLIDKKKLSKAYKEMFKLIAYDIPYIFLYIPNSITAINKNIKNIKPAFTGVWHNQHQWEKIK